MKVAGERARGRAVALAKQRERQKRYRLRQKNSTAARTRRSPSPDYVWSSSTNVGSDSDVLDGELHVDAPDQYVDAHAAPGGEGVVDQGFPAAAVPLIPPVQFPERADSPAPRHLQSSDSSDPDEDGVVLGPVVAQPAEVKDAAWLARELVKIKCMGEVSDTVMEKMTKFFLENLEDIASIQRSGTITSSFRHSIIKRLDIALPEVTHAVKYIDLENPDEDPVYVGNLQAIPKKYLNPTLTTHYYVLRTESHVPLAHIKRHYEETHQWLTNEELWANYRSALIGIDGVKEANKGSRSLVIVSIMFGGCVFLWRVYNPIKNYVGAKATAQELLQ